MSRLENYFMDQFLKRMYGAQKQICRARAAAVSFTLPVPAWKRLNSN